MSKQAKPKDFISDDEMAKLSTSSGDDFISDDDMLKMEAPKKSAGGALQTGVEQFANTAALGYLPSLAGKIGQGLISSGLAEDPYANIVMAKGSKEEKPKFDDVAIRDELNKEMSARLAEHPVAGTVGMLGGAIGSGLAGGAALKGAGLVSEGAQTAGLLGRTLKAGASGAAIGAIQNPGDVEGERSGLQIPERIENAKFGGLMGAGGQLAGEAIAAGANAIKKAGSGLLGFGQGRSLKAIGTMKKDVSELVGKDRVDEITKFAQDNKLTRPGADYSSIADESLELKKKAGQEIGDIYKKVGDNTKISLDKNKLFSELVDAVDEVKPKGGGKAFDDKMQNLIEEFSTNKNIGDVREANEIIGYLDDHINHGKRFGDLPENQQAYMKLRQKMRDIINTHVDDAAEKLGDPEMGKKLREANKKYQNASTINKISQDRTERELANRWFSPTDYGAAGLGVLTSSGDSDTPEGIAGRLARGAAFGLANKGARTYLNPAISNAAMSTGRAMQGANLGLLQQASQYPGLLGAGTAALAGPRKLKNGK